MPSEYNEMEVISAMDTSESEDNSINKSEKFIQCKNENSAKHHLFPSPAFEFPPGHKIWIFNFVNKEVERIVSK